MALPSPKAEVVALSEFRVQAAKWLARVAASQTPLFITRRGRARAVLLTPEAYDHLVDLATKADEARPVLSPDPPPFAALDDDSRTLLAVLREKDGCSFDEVALRSALPIARVMPGLLALELAGLVERSAQGPRLKRPHPSR